MAKLNISGKTVTVDDNFLSMSPDEQNAAVEEIAGSLSQGQHLQQAPSWNPENSVGGFIGNIPSSAYKLGAGAINLADSGLRAAGGTIGRGLKAAGVPESAFSEFDKKNMQTSQQAPANIAAALQGIGEFGSGAINSIPGIEKSYPALEAMGAKRLSSDELASQKQAFSNSPLGSPLQMAQAAYTDPVGDAAMLVPGLGGASKLASVAKMDRLAGGLSKAAEYANIANLIVKPVSRFGNSIDEFSRAAPQGQTRFSAAILRNTLPKDLSAMDRLGPEGMLMDASPSMTGLARGVSAGVGPGTDQIVQALMKRETGKSARLQTGAKNIFGSASDPEALKKAIDAIASKEASPFYKQAKEQTPEFRNDALVKNLQRQLTDPAKGMTEGARTQNMKWMNQIEDAMKADNPQDAASRLHGLRRELDNVINPGPMASAIEKNIGYAAQNARNAVDDILKNRIPGFSEGDAIVSRAKKAQEAVDIGYNSLEGGKSAVFPQSFSRDVNKFGPTYIKEGQKSRIANAMGTQSNDLPALRKMLGGEGDFNREKLAQIFGQRAVDKGVSLVDAEGSMSQNFADIVRNSKTAQSQQAAEMIKGNSPFRVDAGMTTLGLSAKAGASLVNSVIGKVSGKVSATTSEALAKALVFDKTTATKLIADLARNQKVPTKDIVLIYSLLAGKAAELSTGPQ